MRDGEFLQKMGEKIKKARLAKKLSIAKLAALTKTDMSNLWTIEKGTRNVRVLTLKAIADALNIDIRELL